MQGILIEPLGIRNRPTRRYINSLRVQSDSESYRKNRLRSAWTGSRERIGFCLRDHSQEQRDSKTKGLLAEVSVNPDQTSFLEEPPSWLLGPLLAICHSTTGLEQVLTIQMDLASLKRTRVISVNEMRSEIFLKTTITVKAWRLIFKRMEAVNLTPITIRKAIFRQQPCQRALLQTLSMNSDDSSYLMITWTSTTTTLICNSSSCSQRWILTLRLQGTSLSLTRFVNTNCSRLSPRKRRWLKSSEPQLKYTMSSKRQQETPIFRN